MIDGSILHEINRYNNDNEESTVGKPQYDVFLEFRRQFNHQHGSYSFINIRFNNSPKLASFLRSKTAKMYYVNDKTLRIDFEESSANCVKYVSIKNKVFNYFMQGI